MLKDEDIFPHFYRSDTRYLTEGHGIKQEYIHEDSKLLAQEFICGICLNLVYDPMECMTCFQLFCRNCMYKWVGNSDGWKCPNKCKKFENKFNHKLKKILSTIKMVCPNNNIGCSINLNYEEFIQHIKHCHFSNVICLGEGCKFSGTKNDVVEHIPNCRFLLTRCEYCYNEIVKFKLNDHLNTCEVKKFKEEKLEEEINEIEEEQNFYGMKFFKIKKKILKIKESEVGGPNLPDASNCLNTKNSNIIKIENICLVNEHARPDFSENPTVSNNVVNNSILNPEITKLIQLEMRHRLNFDKMIDGFLIQKSDSLNLTPFISLPSRIYKPHICKIHKIYIEKPYFHEATNVQIGSQGKNPEDIHNLMIKNPETGVSSASPGDLVFELKSYYHFNEIEIACMRNYIGASLISNKGRSSLIYVSQDKVNWTEVGILPNEYNSKVIKVKILRSFAKYIRFTNDKAITISYLDILPLNYEYYEDFPKSIICDYSHGGEYVDSSDAVFPSDLKKVNGTEKDSFQTKRYLLIRLKYSKHVYSMYFVSSDRSSQPQKKLYTSRTGLKDDWSYVDSFTEKLTIDFPIYSVKYIKIICSPDHSVISIKDMVIK